MAKPKRCETCCHAQAYDPPKGPRPTCEPPKPKLWQIWAGYPLFDFDFTRQLMWDAADKAARTSVRCRRFPEATKKAKDDLCGEWHG